MNARAAGNRGAHASGESGGAPPSLTGRARFGRILFSGLLSFALALAGFAILFGVWGVKNPLVIGTVLTVVGLWGTASMTGVLMMALRTKPLLLLDGKGFSHAATGRVEWRHVVGISGAASLHHGPGGSVAFVLARRAFEAARSRLSWLDRIVLTYAIVYKPASSTVLIGCDLLSVFRQDILSISEDLLAKARKKA